MEDAKVLECMTTARPDMLSWLFQSLHRQRLTSNWCQYHVFKVGMRSTYRLPFSRHTQGAIFLYHNIGLSLEFSVFGRRLVRICGVSPADI